MRTKTAVATQAGKSLEVMEVNLDGPRHGEVADVGPGRRRNQHAHGCPKNRGLVHGRIREEGLDVTGVGEGNAPESLRNACNRFILIENLIDTATPSKTSGVEAPIKINPSKAAPLVPRAMEKVNSDDDWCHLGSVGQHIIAHNPDFDTRTYGEKKLSDLVKELKRFETRKEGNQLVMCRRVD